MLNVPLISAALVAGLAVLFHLLPKWFLFLLFPLLLLLIPLASIALSLLLAVRLDSRHPSPAHPRVLAHASKPFAFTSPAAWEARKTRSQWLQTSSPPLPPLYPPSPALSSTVNELICLVLRDFVQVWYKEISDSHAFPNAVGLIVHESLQSLLLRASRIDFPSFLVNRILPRITEHIEHFRQSEIALRGATLERKLTQSDELDMLLASRYATSSSRGKLHPAVDNLSTAFTKQSEEAHLRSLIRTVLPYVLPQNERKSHAILIVAREIVSCAVLYPVMEMLSDPDFWNRTIEQVAGAAIHQQRLITKVRHVLEAQSPKAHHRHSNVPHTPAPAEKITIHTDTRHFESFLRSINRCSSLLDARRLKNDILGEIRRTRASLANHENEDWIGEEKTEDVVAFLDRLYTAKRKVEERIVILGGTDDSTQTTFNDPPAKPALSLRDILRNPSSLSYFMEFMDRRQRSLLVQFWLTVESFKNPLEPVDIDSDSESEEASHSSSIKDPRSTVKEDIIMIHDLYFHGPRINPLLANLPRKYIEAIQEFASQANEGEEISHANMRRVRKRVLLAQRQIERDMEQDFEEFERSELWFRVVGDLDTATQSKTASSSPSPTKRPIPMPETKPPLPTKSFSSHPLLSSIVSPNSRSTPMLATRLKSESTSGLPSRSRTPPITGLPMKRTSSQDSTSSGPPKPSSSSSQHKPPSIDLLMSSPSRSTYEGTTTRAPLFDDPDDQIQRKEEEQMEAIQAALTDIVALEGEEEADDEEEDAEASLFGNRKKGDKRGKRKTMFDDEENEEEAETEEGESGLQRFPSGGSGIGSGSARGVEDAEDLSSSFHQLPASGNLHLSYEIARLSDKIESLQAQDTMIDTFIKKAELTGDTKELRLLNTSRQSLHRELRELKFQKSQYEQQESASRLFADRTKVIIPSSTESDEDGKSVVRYLVEVQQLASDGTFSSGWVVARRYNEFLNLHNRLKDKITIVRTLDFPGKRLVTHFSAGFVDARRVALEKYMQSVVAIPKACESIELRTFLSRDSPFAAGPISAEEITPNTKVTNSPDQSGFGAGLVRNAYRTLTESIDDMFFGQSMLDVIIQRLTRQAAELAGIAGNGINDEDFVTQALNATMRSAPLSAILQLTGDLKPLDGETSTSVFSAPICDLILAVFELNKENNWLRKQAIIIILQQVLGGTVERKIREIFQTQVLEESRMLSLISAFREGLWPGGKLKPPSPPRTAEEKLKTRDEANKKLSMAVPDFAANMIGRSNARRGARRIFAVLQNRRLNQHIVYTVVDEVFAALFPEAMVYS